MLRLMAMRCGWYLAALLLASCDGDRATDSNASDRPETDIVCYLSDPSGEPPPVGDLEASIGAALVLHAEHGGSTYSLRWGDLSGADLWAVSLFPDLTATVVGRDIGSEALSAFVRDNLEVLSHPHCALGTFYFAGDSTTFIDVSLVLADSARALELGRRYNQISVFNLQTFEEIPTCDLSLPGKTCGASVDYLSSPLERLNCALDATLVCDP